MRTSRPQGMDDVSEMGSQGGAKPDQRVGHTTCWLVPAPSAVLSLVVTSDAQIIGFSGQRALVINIGFGVKSVCLHSCA